MSTTTFFLPAGPGWDRLHAGPLAGHVDDFADRLAGQGYARKTGRRKLRLVGQFSRWLGDRAFVRQLESLADNVLVSCTLPVPTLEE